MSERQATKSDLPFWSINKHGVIQFWGNDLWAWASGNGEYFTHWQPATLPEPPKKELTQRERDTQGFAEWEGRLLTTHYTDYDVWHAALAYRDKQNAQDLRNTLGDPAMSPFFKAGIASLRRRCGLDQ